MDFFLNSFANASYITSTENAFIIIVIIAAASVAGDVEIKVNNLWKIRVL